MTTPDPARSRLWPAWVWVVAIVGACAVIAWLSAVFVPLALGLLLAAVLEPIVTRLAGPAGSRVRATLIVLGTVLTALAILVAIAVPMLIREGRHWVASVRGEGRAELSRSLDQPIDYGAWVDPEQDQWQLSNLVADAVQRKAPPAVVRALQSAHPTASDDELPLCEALADDDCDGLLDPGYARRWKVLKKDRGGWAASLAQTLDRSGVTRAFDRWQRSTSVQGQLNKWLQGDGLAGAGEVGKRVFSSVGSLLSALLQWSLAAFLVPLYAFSFLQSLPHWRHRWPHYVPAAHRDRWAHIVQRIASAIQGFVRGRLVVCAIVGLMTGLGWMLLGVRLGLLLGLAIGALTIVPFVHVLALAPALLMSLLEVAMGTHGWGWLAGVLAVYAAGQVADSVCTPLIVGDAVQLDMVTILVALLIGGAVAGAVGLVLAVPMAATLRILAEELVWPRWRRWASGTTEGPPAPPES